jgi:hypothetical protein
LQGAHSEEFERADRISMVSGQYDPLPVRREVAPMLTDEVIE